MLLDMALRGLGATAGNVHYDNNWSWDKKTASPTDGVWHSGTGSVPLRLCGMCSVLCYASHAQMIVIQM